MLWALLSLAAGDNIQVNKDSFKTVAVGHTVYHSKDLYNNSALKISFPGYLVYGLEERSPGNFLLVDRTVYLGRKEAVRELRTIVEEVQRPFGISFEVTKMILVIANLCILGLIVTNFLFPRLENYLEEKEKED